MSIASAARRHCPAPLLTRIRYARIIARSHLFFRRTFWPRDRLLLLERERLRLERLRERRRILPVRTFYIYNLRKEVNGPQPQPQSQPLPSQTQQWEGRLQTQRRDGNGYAGGARAYPYIEIKKSRRIATSAAARHENDMS